MKRILLSLVTCALMAAPVFGVSNLGWGRGDPGTTYQLWTFDDDDNPAVPEIYENPYGDPVADITTSVGGWYEEYLSRPGVWASLSTNIDIFIPNQIAPDNWKEIWLEIGHRGTPDITVDPFPSGGSVDLLFQNTVLVDPTNNWFESTYAWHITPNPNEEHIYISITGTGGSVDYVSVDTICVPEPMTVCLLGLGGLLLRRRKTF